MSHGDQVRFRTLTRTRYLAMSSADREARLTELYRDNLDRVLGALEFCRSRGIRLYRAPSGLFPMSDEALGEQILAGMRGELARFGVLADRYRIRVVQHPDQFVVLNSESDRVVRQSIAILAKHALAFDLFGLPRSSWSAIILHGGKAGRTEQLCEVIDSLPSGVRERFVLENDERSYSAREILEICRRTGVPMVFDAHHHVIREGLDSYDDPSVAAMTRAARRTWPKPGWQIVHLSNGLDSFADPRHSERIHAVPGAYAAAPWIEVEAKGKEQAIDALRRMWPAAR